MASLAYFFYKIQNGLAPLYLKNVIPQYVTTYRTRNLTALRNFPARTDLFSFSFFPHTIRNWNSLDPSIRNLSSVQLFKNALLKFIRPSHSPLYGINHPLGIKLLSRLRLGLSHLREHKFRHNFLDTINPLCSCNIEPKSTTHFLLHCHFFSEHRKTLFDSLKAIDISIIAMSDKVLTHILLFGSNLYTRELNASIIDATITFLLSTERFNQNLM